MNCKFCGSDKIKLIRTIQSLYVSHKYILYQCAACKCRFFNPKEHNVDIENIYEEYSTKHNKEVSNFQFKKSFYWTRQVQRIEKILGKKASSVLDVGCRTGDFLLHFPDNIVREGIELSENSAEIAKKRGLVVYKDFAENINFDKPDKQYDIVTCYAVLEHLLDPLHFLDKLSNIISSGGGCWLL